MAEIGQELRQAREALGLSLEEISSSTMISRKYLQALEEEDYNVFPGEVYLKGALRKYAAELKLDPEPLLARYSGTTVSQVPTPAAPREEKAAKIPAAPAVVPAFRPPKRLRLGRLVLYLVILALLVTGVWAIGNMIANRPPAADPPVTDNGPEEPADPGDDNGTEEPAEPETRLLQDQNDSRLYYLYNADSIDAGLSFTADCWVRAYSDGERLFSNTFSSGQTRTFSAAEEAAITFGYPRGAVLTVNGIEVELPQIGSAHTVTIRNEGYDE